MKTVNKIKEKKHKTVKKPIIKTKKEKILVVAQEIKFARLLSGNDKKTRDRVLKSFKKWLLACFDKEHEFKEDDFIRVWKGLFYAVWMSDKPLVQEDLCETIAGILDLFPPNQLKYALMLTKAGFKVLATEWYGIDQHRMDKFLMLVRRYLRGSLRCLHRCKWKLEACKKYANMLSASDGILSLKTPLYARNAGSMLLHFVDCFLEELSKVSEGNLPPASVVELFRPFCSYMALGESPALVVAARRLLTALLRQSDRGLEYRERTRAWEQMGCPRGGPDALELASDDEESANDDEDNEEEEDYGTEKPLDPRAGRVDVILHTIPVPAEQIAEVLRGLLTATSSKAYKRTKICLERFQQLSKDTYPLRVADIRDEDETPKPKPAAAAKALRALEKTLVKSADELTLRGLSRKHRKRLLAKTRAGLSILEDVPQQNITSTNGDWAVEAAEPKKENKKTNKQKNKDASDKENVHKDKNVQKRKPSDVQTEKNNKKLKQKDTQTQNNVKAKPAEKVDKTPVKNIEKSKQKVPKNNKVPQLVAPQKSTVVTPQKSKEKLQNKSQENTEKPKQDTKLPEKKIKIELATPQKSPGKHTNLHARNKKDSLSKSDKRNILNGRVQKKHEENVKKAFASPKKVKFILKNNSMQGTMDYYKSIRQSPSIPYDSSKKPSKTNLKVSTPSPINPFFKKMLRLKKFL